MKELEALAILPWMDRRRNPWKVKVGEESDMQEEEVLLRPWLKEQLSSRAKTLTDLAAGDLITGLLRCPPAKRNLNRTSSVPSGKSLEAKLIRVYTLVTRLLRGRPPLFLEG